MADLQEQLQSILGDPQAMRQITAIAQALTGGGSAPVSAPGGQDQAGQGPIQDVDFVPVAPPTEGQPPPGRSQGGGSEYQDPSALSSDPGLDLLTDLDPRFLQIAMRVFSEYSAKDDDKAALLTALRPFLRPERQEKLEKAASIARLSRVVRVAVELLREEGGHV